MRDKNNNPLSLDQSILNINIGQQLNSAEFCKNKIGSVLFDLHRLFTAPGAQHTVERHDALQALAEAQDQIEKALTLLRGPDFDLNVRKKV